MNIRVLGDINTWWATGRVDESFLEPVPRRIMPEIMAAIDERQIVLLEGPRRVGKTSLIFHIIKNLIHKGVDPKRIIYISLDDPLVGKDRFFENLIEIIETYILSSHLRSVKERIYLFLDEVTHLKDWELYLKRYYDQQYPFKFIVSSSSASFLVKKGRESLAGRLFRFRVLPFSFSEFLYLKGASKEVISLQNSLYPVWQEYSVRPDNNSIFNLLSKTFRRGEIYGSEINTQLHQFLINGGFPEFLKLKSERLISQYFPENIIERVIYHDIPETFGVSDRTLLQNLLLYSVFHSGSIININEIATSFNATRQTVSDYLYYLQASMIVRLLEKYAKTAASRLRAFRKIYTIDSGLYVHLQRLSPSQIQQKGILGQLAEIAVFSQLNSFKGINIFYFREKETEVDFVIETPSGIIPIEVKYRESIKDIKGIKYCIERFKSDSALVITKDLLKLDGKTLFVPLRLFLC